MDAINSIYIIDDDHIFTFITERMITSNHYSEKVNVFSNGEDAINQIKYNLENDGELPDVIILDLNMPIMDGWEFLEHFNELDIQKRITIYIVSSSIDIQDIERVREYEKVSNYLIKPITAEKLVDLIAGTNLK